MSSLSSAVLRHLRVDVEALGRLSAEDRLAVAEKLRVVEEAFRRNPLLGYEPHARQVVFHEPPFVPSRLFLGGNRSGKSTATMVDTIVQAVDWDVVPEHLRGFKRWSPPFYGRIVGPDLTRWLEGVGLQKFREWCPRDQLVGGGFARGWDKQQLTLRFKNDSWIQFMSNDQDLDKFAGTALHRVVYDESPRQDIRRECLMRLIDYGGEELFGLTPVDGMSNWLFDEFYEPWEAGLLDGSAARLVLVDMDANPHLSQDAKKWALQGLSPEERQARKTGRFVSFAGLIFPEWSRAVVPEVSDVPASAEVFCGVDPGYRHMCAVVFCFLDVDDSLVVFDEIALGQRKVSDICREIKLRCARWRVQPQWFVIDPAAKNRNNQTGRSDQQEFADNGIVTIPGQNDVRAGINRVKERLEADRLKVAANCTELIAEFKKYRWAKESTRSENEAPERPVKRDDHLIDCVRYVTMQRPLAPDRDVPRPSDTLKDRLLRHSLRQLRSRGRGDVPADHFAGSGIFS